MLQAGLVVLVTRIPMIEPAILLTMRVTRRNEDRVIVGELEDGSIVAALPSDERGAIESVEMSAPCLKCLVRVVVGSRYKQASTAEHPRWFDPDVSKATRIGICVEPQLDRVRRQTPLTLLADQMVDDKAELFCVPRWQLAA